MTTVFIQGLGIIGSSLARAIRQAHPAIQIVANDSNQNSLKYALAHHLIDQGATDLSSAQNADFIILATPVSQIINDIAVLAQLKLKPGVVVTDVGSTKRTVMNASVALTKHGITFIGGHPMAGSHLTGVTAGRADLVQGAYYFLVSGPNDEQAVKKLKNLLSGLQVKWRQVDPKHHDQIVAQISHLPHIIAATLMNQTQENLGADLQVAAGGFKSVTRIAAADPRMWSAVLLNNQDLIRQQLHSFIAKLQEIDGLIAANDQDALLNFFCHSQASRRQLGFPNHKNKEV